MMRYKEWIIIIDDFCKILWYWVLPRGRWKLVLDSIVCRIEMYID